MNQSLDRVYNQVKSVILDKTQQECVLEDDTIFDLIDEELALFHKEHGLLTSQRRELEQDIYNGLRGMDVIQELMDDEEVTEIMINGHEHIFYEKNGKLYPYDRSFHSKERYLNFIWRLAGDNNRMVNEAIPIVDTILKDGSRVNIVMDPIAIEGPVMTIRKFKNHRMNLDELIRLNTMDRWVADLLVQLVKCKYNIFIYGGTGSGKTVLLNALSEYIPEKERIVTIEDAAELQLKQVQNLVRLQVRQATLEGRNGVSIRDLLKTSLRLRPDRIILGEVRGSECVDLLQVMNTGHAGSISTGHGNSCREMIDRITTMTLMGIDMPVSAIHHQIAAGIDIMVQVGRCMDGSRKILEVDELDGMLDGTIQIHSLVQYCRKEGKEKNEGWKKTGTLKNQSKLEQYEPIYSS